MRKSVSNTTVFIGVLILGIVILLSSIKIGENLALQVWKYAHNTLHESSNFYIEQYIINFRFIGAIISLIGGLGVVISINKD